MTEEWTVMIVQMRLLVVSIIVLLSSLRKNLIFFHANNKGADQPVQLCSDLCYSPIGKYIISKFAASEITSF